VTTASPPPDPPDIGRLFAMIERWHAETTQPTIPAAMGGSALAGDDAKLGNLQLSHLAWTAHVGAVDHLDAIRRLAADPERLGGQAPYTLVRSVLENAATVVWLLEPRARKQRLTRSLRVAWFDAWESGNVREMDDRLQVAAPGRPADVRMAEIKQMAKGLGIDPADVCRQLYYGPLVREAAALSGYDPVATEVTWKVCAGISHGRRWAILAYLQRVTVSQTANVKAVALGTTLESLAWMLLPAAALAGHGRDLYEVRRTSPF
jgi:hypothetical protein